MTRDEIIELLQLIHDYDSRKIDGILIAAYGESARRANWNLRDATEAVHDYYANTSDKPWIMPGDITERIRAARRHPAPIDELRALNPPAPASAETRAKVMAAVRQLADKKGLPDD